MIIKGKRLYVTRMRDRQFLSSREVQQSPNGKEFEYIDGIFVKALLPDITFGEGFRFINLRIETNEFDGGHQMWVAGKFRHRFLTEEKPDYDGDGGFMVTNGDALYLSFNGDVDYFPRMPECIFPVWVECLPGEEWDEDDYMWPLTFDSEGFLDRDGEGHLFFSDKLHGQVDKFLCDAGLNSLKMPVRCRLVIEVERKKVEQ